MTRDPMHKTVCDRCGRGTWYETEGPCRYEAAPQHCPTCGQTKPYPETGWGACPGTLRLIDRSALAPAFAGYYESGERIRVQHGDEEPRTGTVGKTTGWRPSYMLMANVRSMGSSDLLGPEDRVIAVKRGRTYLRTEYGRATA